MHIDEADYNESDGVECPWDGCDNISESVTGMKIHHAQSHGESIAGELVKCDWCGNTRREGPDRARNQEHHFCLPEEGERNSDCQNKWQSEEWGNGPSPVPRDKVTVECSWCGTPKDVQRHIYEKNDHHFCSPTDSDNVHSECYKNWLSENYVGENSPVWSGRMTVECAWCDEPKEIEPYRYKYNDRFFCDAGCHANWMSENLTGENSPHWKEYPEVECAWCGDTKKVKPSTIDRSKNRFCNRACQEKWWETRSISRTSRNYYGPNWDEQREKRIQHDGERCIKCGLTREEHYLSWGVDIHVHHVSRKESFRRDDGTLDYESANRVKNLLTLCQEHHPEYEGIPIDTRHITTADD